MNFKRLTTIVLVLLLSLSLFTGCKSNVNNEEGAAVDTFVEGEKQEQDNDGPQKVEGNDNQQNDQQGNDQQGNDQQGNDQQGNDQQGNDQQGNDQQGNDQQGNDQQGNDQQGNDQQGNDQQGDNSGEDDTTVNVEYDPENHLKVLDYNIRCADDGVNEVTGSSNNIEDRAPRLLALIEKYDPDIIGLQEAVPEWIKYLEEGIGGHQALVLKYEMRYKYRAESSQECTPLLWKKDKFELLEEGYYWLSETPDEESKGWGAKHYRICNWVRLKIKATGKIFVFVNTHLQGGTPATNSAPLIAARTKKVGGFTKYPVILTGDFNYAPWSEPYGAFLAEGFIDLNDALGFNHAYTNNGYNSRPDSSETNSIKDYIMYGGEDDMITPLTYNVLNEKYYDGWISDHRGLYGEFAIL